MYIAFLYNLKGWELAQINNKGRKHSFSTTTLVYFLLKLYDTMEQICLTQKIKIVNGS